MWPMLWSFWIWAFLADLHDRVWFWVCWIWIVAPRVRSSASPLGLEASEGNWRRDAWPRGRRLLQISFSPQCSILFFVFCFFYFILFLFFVLPSLLGLSLTDSFLYSTLSYWLLPCMSGVRLFYNYGIMSCWNRWSQWCASDVNQFFTLNLMSISMWGLWRSLVTVSSSLKVVLSLRACPIFLFSISEQLSFMRATHTSARNMQQCTILQSSIPPPFLDCCCFSIQIERNNTAFYLFICCLLFERSCPVRCLCSMWRRGVCGAPWVFSCLSLASSLPAWVAVWEVRSYW